MIRPISSVDDLLELLVNGHPLVTCMRADRFVVPRSDLDRIVTNLKLALRDHRRIANLIAADAVLRRLRRHAAPAADVNELLVRLIIVDEPSDTRFEVLCERNADAVREAVWRQGLLNLRAQWWRISNSGLSVHAG